MNFLEKLLILKKCHVFVVGDIILDHYIEGQVDRISPEAPVPVLRQKEERFVLGGAANPAANISHFGAKTTLCGRIGQDSHGKKIIQLCEKYQIQTNSIIESIEVPTICKTRVLAGYQQMIRIDKEEIRSISQETCELILQKFEAFAQNDSPHKALIISDYAKGFITEELTKKLIHLSQKYHIPCIIDPKSSDLSRYDGCTLLKPNLKDGRELLDKYNISKNFKNIKEEALAICELYHKYMKVDCVVLSLSAHGVMLYTQNKEIYHLPSQALKVADVSGAGDTMVSFLAMGMACKLPYPDIADIANRASGLVCAKQGTATLSFSELVEDPSLNHGKTLSFEEISEFASICKKDHKKIVFTNGCFDILHIGHIHCLQKAKALGDILVVGLNTDESVSRLKGPTRPIQKEKDRAEILSALSCVDVVVFFNEETPLKLIEAITPHVLVKGGDYIAKDVVGYGHVVRNGGKVEIISFVEGRSTTRIVEESKKS